MKLVILDRDGTINYDSEHHIKSLDEWRPIKGSLEAIARLTQAGYRIVVDQPVRHRARTFHHANALRYPRSAAARGRAGGRTRRCLLLLPARGRRRLPVQEAPTGHAA